MESFIRPKIDALLAVISNDGFSFDRAEILARASLVSPSADWTNRACAFPAIMTIDPLLRSAIALSTDCSIDGRSVTLFFVL